METNYKHKYLEFKERNEQQLLEIRKIESQIAKVQHQIDSKRKSILRIKETESYYGKLLHEHKIKYQKKTINKEITSDLATVEEPVFYTGKRDLLQVLSATPEVILKKIIALIEQQYSTQNLASSEEITQIKILLDRLSDEHSTFWNKYIDEWIKEMKEVTVIDKDEIKNMKKELELETREAEMNIVRRIKELHSDPNVQAALIKNIRIKAANQQANVELQSTINQIEDIKKSIDLAKKSLNMDTLKAHIDNLLNDLDKRQSEVQSLLATNDEFRKVLIKKSLQRQEEAQSDSKELIDRIKKIKSNVHIKTSSSSSTSANQSIISDTLGDICNLINPYSSISINQALLEISNTIDLVNDLSKENVSEICVDIRLKLENLFNKWCLLLEKQNISVPEDVAENHDGIDKIIQSVDALRMHIQNEEQNYIQKQEHIIEAKLSEADEIQEEIKHTKESLKERELLKHIGSNYILQSKNFNQWLQALQIKDNKYT
ncbi:uncharacterized protein BX663DRAFT_494642 [Cokeromyces recurvatus]|uniref:uncharacterized protein n=1 Tax=Cokeromyces recurvatus TaxID=90255 RepID=UPI00221E77C1|nr:uncharacterized protein BX663DRAFT_494642 [Cokeromyces recurvatus]KAI7907047.1 hypothetical protein BX663DRAFT_494642 [Cokeromyces recurvatus]